MGGGNPEMFPNEWLTYFQLLSDDDDDNCVPRITNKRWGGGVDRKNSRRDGFKNRWVMIRESLKNQKLQTRVDDVQYCVSCDDPLLFSLLFLMLPQKVWPEESFSGLLLQQLLSFPDPDVDNFFVVAVRCSEWETYPKPVMIDLFRLHLDYVDEQQTGGKKREEVVIMMRMRCGGE